MNLHEAERQVLSSLRGAELEAQPNDRTSLEKRGERYWIFLEDWMREAEAYLPAMKANRVSRYFYHVRL